MLPPTGLLIKCKSAKACNPLDGQQVAALRCEESFSRASLCKNIEGRKKGLGGWWWKKMVETEASAEVRDEKGKTLFSFHVIKYLLCLHISPTDRHSGLKGH